MNDIDDQYRRASAQDPSRPSESTRRNILANAAKVAAQRAAGVRPAGPDFRRPAANQPTFIGTLAAAALAGLLMTPLFLPPRAPLPAKSSDMVAKQVPVGEAVQGARTPLAAPSAPSEVASPAAKLTRAAPPASDHYVPDEPAAAGGPVAASSALQESAPRASAGPAPAAPRDEAMPQPVPSNQSGNAQPSIALRSRLAAPQMLGGAITAGAATVMLQQAAAAGDVSRLQSLLAIPIDINTRDAEGRTPLMLATLEGQAGAVDILLAHGADANAADANGVTPLQAALTGAKPGIADALRRAGAH